MIQNNLFLSAFVNCSGNFFLIPSQFKLDLLNIMIRQYLNMSHVLLFLGILWIQAESESK